MKPRWIAAALFTVVALVFLLVRASEKVAPVPVALWVAIQPEGETVARGGVVELAAGAKFQLHAVLEAETFRGGRVYYTETKQLELGGEPIAAELLEPWPGRLDARVLWFAVEGSASFRELHSDDVLEPPRFQAIFRADWGQAWTVAGDLRPTVENFLPGEEDVRRERRFGVQRFQVRIELFDRGSPLVPQMRIASWGSEEVTVRVAQFPTVVATAPGALAGPSRVFGLPQLEFAGTGANSEVAEQLARWTGDLIAFSRISVLGNWLASEGIGWEELAWSSVEVGASGDLTVAARPGDLLRVGGRLVWLLEDRGAAGLDGEDWCLDFDRGARVQRLGDIFVGEGLVDWARAPSSGPGSSNVVE